MAEPTRRGETPFLTTRWSVVIEAGRGDASESSRAALGELCETYWYPLYAYVRRRGWSTEDARDLTQSFFTRLLEKNVVHTADPARGRFRAFLLGSLKNFLANEWDRETAQKRGGGRKALSLDFELADARLRREPVEHATPEREYERNWALAVLERALARLEVEFRGRGKLALFERLKPALTAGDEDEPRLAMARDLGMSEGAVKVAVHRMRQAFKDALRREIAETVRTEDEIDDELRILFDALGAPGAGPR